MSTSQSGTQLADSSAPILSSLFGQSLNQFPNIPTTGVANDALGSIPNDVNLQGYNPSATVNQGLGLADQGTTAANLAPSQLNTFSGVGNFDSQTARNISNYLLQPGMASGIAGQGQAANTAMVGAGNSVYNTLAGQAGIPEAAGQQTFNTLNQAGQGAAAGGNAIYNSLMGQAGAPIAAGQQQYGELNPYIGQILQQGFDPQQALYNQQFALQQQQTAAANAMSGVGQSPYGAGLSANANTNFNIDWQQSQLNREATAAQAASGLSSTAMGDLTSGYNTAAGMENTAGSALQAGLANQGSLMSAGAGALNQGYNTGSNMLLGGASALNAGYTGGLNNIATANTTNLNNTMGAMNALSGGLGAQTSAYDTGLGGYTGLLGAGGNAATTGAALGQSGATVPSGLNQAAVSQLLQYLGLGSTNAANQLGAENQSFSAANQLTGIGTQAQTAANAQSASSLGGLGSLLGTLGGAAIKAGAL